jgi:hypothetical protein
MRCRVLSSRLIYACDAVALLFLPIAAANEKAGDKS